MTTAAEKLAALAAGVRAEDLPAEVVQEAKRRLIDAMGCMLAGASGGPVRAVFDAVGQSTGSATIVGDRRRAGIPEAALANCTALRYLDYMDGHPGPYPCHPSLVIPAVLAAAEAEGTTGLEVLRAIALGYELDIRLQLGSGDPDITVHGWSGSTNLGLAVPFATGGLLGLSEEQLAHALAISAVHAPTLNVTTRGQMAPSKACVDGMIALSALAATLVARGGMHGKLTAIDADDGFLPLVGREVDEAVVLGPIERFRVLDTYTKYFNAVKCAQTAANAALVLRERFPTLDEVERITVRVAERDWKYQSQDDASRRRPSNRDTANHSLVYCVAAVLVDGELGVEQFGPSRLSDPEILQAVDRIVIDTDPALTEHWPAANPATVEITTRSGEVWAETTLYSPGHPKNPISGEQLEAKFRGLAGGALDPDRVVEVIECIWRLDELADIRELTGLVTAP